MGGAFAGIEKLLASPSHATWPLVDMGSHGATRSWMKTWFAFCPKECWMIGMTREWQYRFSLRNMVAREHSNRRRCHHRRVQGKIGQVWVFSYCVRSLFGHWLAFGLVPIMCSSDFWKLRLHSQCTLLQYSKNMLGCSFPHTPWLSWETKSFGFLTNP
jgi:hypothetical protein